MKGVTNAAKLASGRNRSCASCPIRIKYKACPPEILRVCHDAFVNGFKKGVKFAKEQLKSKQNG